MKSFYGPVLLVIIFGVAGCGTLELGMGTSYNYGNSGGCEPESGAGIHLQSSYIFGKDDGVGVRMEMFLPGYTDCNDSDPLIFLSPQVIYQMELSSQKWFAELGAGYATGVYVDPGYLLSGGIKYRMKRKIFISLEQDFFRAFQAKQNAIKPGTSKNSTSQVTLGIYF